MALAHLPIDDVLGELIAAVKQHRAAVLHAPTGAGKTTRLPGALLEAGLAAGRRVIVLEPRRIAARAAARRIAEERGSRLGGEVGWQVRFEKVCGRDTRILFVTEGIYVRMLQDDPFLESVGAVVFDEFHERSLDADLALAMTRRVREEVRPDLTIVAASATLDVEPISAYLGGAPIVRSQGRTFPVEIRYWPNAESRPVLDRVASGVGQALAASSGDVLVFLPGVGEIRRIGRDIASLASSHNAAVVELYGDLPADRQDAVLRPGPRRRIVLTTNVAETSVTVPGVTAVVDSGLARVLRFDPATGLNRLEIERISQASADQRAGRAGRTQPGWCVRLWSERDHKQLATHTAPEIHRVDLAGAWLQLRAWGEADPARFPWLDPPSPDVIQQAETLLERLGAVNESGPTTLGRALARLPVHPRLGRLLIEGKRLGQPRRAAMAAALLSERDPFPRGGQGGRYSRAPTIHGERRSESDLLDRVAAMETFEATGRTYTELGAINGGACRFLLQARNQLARAVEYVDTDDDEATGGDGQAGEVEGDYYDDDEGDAGNSEGSRGNDRRAPRRTHDEDEALLRAVLAAFPDRLARRREANSRKALMLGGQGVKLAPESAVLDHELFAAIQVDGADSEALVRIASAVERSWLDESRLTVNVEVAFDSERERVTAMRRTRYEDLVIAESPTAPPDDDRTTRLLAEAAGEQLARVLPSEERATARFLQRARWLARANPDLGLPTLDDDELKTLLPDLCRGKRSFDELRKAPWLDWMRGLFRSDQLATLDREAPEKMTLPSGVTVALDYDVEGPPVLAARIQQLFGLHSTPRIAGGRTAVLVHLLAPNGRPQQITQDLQSFWATTYTEVRKELRRRYPKHAWPEDPTKL